MVLADTSGRARRLMIFGCGYIGTAVAQWALSQGWQVGALTRNPAQAAALRAGGVDPVIEVELDATDWHGRLRPDWDVVLNSVSSAGGGLEGYEKSYRRGQQSILQWAATGQVGTLIYTSSTSVYGVGDGAIVTEATPAEPASPTGQVVRASEQLLEGPPAGIRRAFVLRLAGIYGPGRHHLLDQLRAGESVFPGTGDHFLNLAHQADIVQAVAAAAQAREGHPGGTYLVADGQPATKAEVTRWLAAQLGLREPRFDPAQAPRRMGARLFGRGGPPHRRMDSTRIQQELGVRWLYPDYRAGYAPLLAALR